MRTLARWSAAVAVLVVLGFFAESGLGAPPQYTIQDLGFYQGGLFSGLGLNDLGQVVGSANDGAVMWDHGQYIDLGRYPGAQGVCGVDISNSGLIDQRQLESATDDN